jgi:ankyrin repeat protein
MPTLPANPDLDQLRRRAKDLLRAARGGDSAALDRIHAVSTRVTLAAAQLAVAREHGFASWAKLKEEVESRMLGLAEKVEAFRAASVSARPGRAARLLAETPEIAEYDLSTALLLGDADRVRAHLRRDPGLVSRPDPGTGWTPLHAVCASRLHQLDPSLAGGLAAVARLLIDAGADPLAASPRWTPLGCAIAAANSGPSNRPLVELLLAAGARAGGHDLYLAGFAQNCRELLPLLLARLDEPVELGQALAAPVSRDDAESLRLLLEAGADPRRYRDDDGEQVPAVWAAARAGCSAELVELLLDHGADPSLPGPDGRTPYRVAAAAGRDDLLGTLGRRGVAEDATDAELFVAACLRGDRREAERRLDDDPALLDRLAPDERAALVRAAGSGNTAAVALMLDLGIPLETRDDDGATALHAAAYSGSVETVRLLLARGADVDARDTTWSSPPLDWAAVGSGERPADVPQPDWPATVRLLLEHGASTDSVTLAPDDPKPPSADVAALLRDHLEGTRG